MHVVLIACYSAPYPFSEHHLDYPMLKTWSEHLGCLDIIIQTRDSMPQRWRDEKLTVHYIPTPEGPLRPVVFGIRAFRRLFNIHRQQRVDVVNGSDLLGSLVGVIARYITKAKVIVQLQDDFLQPSYQMSAFPRRFLLKKLAIFISKRANLIRCLYTKSTQQLIREGIDPKKIVTIPSRCNIKTFDLQGFQRVTSKNVRILFVGSLVHRKGVHYMLRAIPEIVQKHPRIKLLIIGRGSAQTELERLARSLGIEDQVDFLGFIPHDQIPQLMRDSDIFVLPSLSEATPRVLMEAMAMELPVIATRVGGIPEMIEDGRTGLLVQPGTVKELAEAINWVLDNPEWCIEAGKRGRKHVAQTYDLELIQQQQIDMHFTVIDK